MPSISRILVPVDFSDRCNEMHPYIKLIGERYQAEVILFHVVNPFWIVPSTGGAGPAAIPTPGWVLPQRTKQLDAFWVHELGDLPVRRLVYEGDPEAQIAAFAQTEGIDLIVMPTHGYGVVRRFLIGSVTAKVLHDIPCPVLTGVHIQPQTSSASVKLANIVCAIDLSQSSPDTLLWASCLANDFGGRASVIHVIPEMNRHHEMPEAAHREIEQLQLGVGVRNLNVCIEQGDVARGVCSFARSVAADLIVIGRTYSGSGRLTSNAYAIIREAPCPVLSI